MCGKVRLHLGLFRSIKGIICFNIEISDVTFNIGKFKLQLYRLQVLHPPDTQALSFPSHYLDWVASESSPVDLNQLRTICAYFLGVTCSGGYSLSRFSKDFADSGIIGLNNGLSDEENLVLFSTVNTEEAFGLIMRGLKELAGQD